MISHETILVSNYYINHFELVINKAYFYFFSGISFNFILRQSFNFETLTRLHEYSRSKAKQKSKINCDGCVRT